MPEVRNFLEAGRVLATMVEVKKRTFIENLYAELVQKTPVCTGYARASWYVTPNIPKTKNELGKRTKSKTCRVIYTYSAKVDLSKYKKNFSVWHITNLAPYAEFLEHGHSKQAPANWIKDIVTRHALIGMA